MEPAVTEGRPISKRVAVCDDEPRPFLGTVGPEQKPVAAPLLEIRDLSIRFQTKERSDAVVNGLSYRIHAGRSLAIVGESGAGKSVSCRALMGLLPRTAVVSGSVRFAGTELLELTEAEMRSYRGAEIAMVFQDPDDALNPTMRVGHQISEAIRLHTGLGRRAAWHQAIELLRSLKMAAPEDRIHAYPHELSGGMKQRVMLAVALAGNPKLLIADESTRALDVTTQAQIVRLIENAQRQRGMAVILISHDLRLAASFADDILVMCGGSALEYAPTSELFERPRTPYTRALLGAMPNANAARQLPRGIVSFDERADDARTSAVGCPFEPRCPSATTACRQQRPPLTEQGFGHHWACWNA
jgi:oligopeptide/dipeptide ABC transporter ATP-binding protein